MMRNALLLITLIVVFSCTGRKNKAEHRDIIPEKDLVSILAETHLADGLLTLPKIRYMYSNLDTLGAYNDICEKYGYNREQLERTMRLYFMKKPKKLIKVYDRVLGILSEMESRIATQNTISISQSVNLWKGKQVICFNSILNEDTTWFNIPAHVTGIYTLKYRLTIYPDDQTIDPRPGSFFSFPDTTSQAGRQYTRSVGFIKDGLPHDYVQSIVISGRAPEGLKGWFIDHEGQNISSEKHYKIENIEILCVPV